MEILPVTLSVLPFVLRARAASLHAGAHFFSADPSRAFRVCSLRGFITEFFCSDIKNAVNDEQKYQRFHALTSRFGINGAAFCSPAAPSAVVLLLSLIHI